MRVVTTRAELAEARAALGTVGFVPTMGFLHEGHLSLVRAARSENDDVVVSIFVNPTQFGPGEDFETYPRDTERDLALLEAEDVDVVWTPGVTDVYPAGSSTRVQVSGVSEVLEGAQRPGHFTGVATVVTILLGATRPTRAYFGQKDAQQVAVVRRFVDDLALGVPIVTVPIAREADGLAMSSRNVRLTAQERRVAPVLYRGLRAAEAAYASGERRAPALRAAVEQVLATEPALTPEYLSVAHPGTLAECETVDAAGALVSLAARLGSVRLIDNVLLGP